MIDDRAVEAALIKRTLSYDPKTGSFTRLPRPLEDFPDERTWHWYHTYCLSQPVGFINREGYFQIKIDQRSYRMHRIAWLLHFGNWPAGQIDHINGNRADNRIINLRLVDHVGNGKNRKRSVNNKSGVTGVRQRAPGGSWLAQIKANRRTINLGAFPTREEAIRARKDAERRHGFHRNHDRVDPNNV